MNTPGSLISYHSDGIWLSGRATAEELQARHPALEAARGETVADVALMAGDPPVEKRPLDAGFFTLPEQILDAYGKRRDASELGRMLAVAERLREQVDRVVVLGIGGSYMGARALMEACREPYFNELSRADRGLRPRMAFEGNNVDNDAVQGLLQLLRGDSSRSGPEGRWGLVVISKSGGTLETAAALRIFLRELESQAGPAALPELVIPVTGASGRLRDLSAELGCREVFDVPDGVGGRFSVLSAVGLLPAAILGIDVRNLLEGAVAMNDHFRAAPVERNVVLQYAGASRLMDELGCTTRVLCAWSKALESIGLWYDQLLAESLGKSGQGSTPLTVVNTRDLHSRAQQHQEGRLDKLFTNLVVEQWRADPVAVGRRESDPDLLNELAETTLPTVMSAALQGTNEALASANQPTADLRLPRADERHVGQLLQMLMLATVVEGRMMGVNPYGQPGVEAYKQNMNRILGRS